jgi:probable HAF family extracellular repeat protein
MDNTLPYDINNKGQVTGVYEDSNGNKHAFMYGDGAFTTLDDPAAAGSVSPFVAGVNNDGQVLGRFIDSKGYEHGFLYSGGHFTTFDVPGGTSTSPSAINNAGQIIGTYVDPAIGNMQRGFIATPDESCSISGTVKDGKGSPLAGVVMALAGVSSAKTKTASNGSYSFSGLSNGDCTVTPTSGQYAFKPQSAQFTLAGKDVTGVDFTGTAVYSISGVVTLGSKPLSGVVVTLSGAKKATMTTGSNGAYSFDGLAAGSYKAIAGKSGYTFQPKSWGITLNANTTGRNFSATKN